MHMNDRIDSYPTELLILAGGLGTRLQPAIRHVPKPMAPVNGVPFLEHLMTHWRSQGIRRFVLSVGYMADAIQTHFGTRYHDCAIDYAVESSPLGTGGAIRHSIINNLWSSERLVIINGDTWFPVQLSKFIADANTIESPVTIAVKRIVDNDRYGGIILDANGLVRKFVTGNANSANPLINGGAYLVDRAYLADYMHEKIGSFSFERDVLEDMAVAGLLGACVQDVQFLDIGIPQDYLRAGELILHDTVGYPTDSERQKLK